MSSVNRSSRQKDKVNKFRAHILAVMRHNKDNPSKAYNNAWDMAFAAYNSGFISKKTFDEMIETAAYRKEQYMKAIKEGV